MAELEYVDYGPWFTINTCPNREEPVTNDDIYWKRCCSNCGESGSIMLRSDVTTLRRAYTRKSIIPFRSKWVYEIKDRKSRFGGGGSCGGFTRSSSSLALTTMAAATIAIF